MYLKNNEASLRNALPNAFQDKIRAIYVTSVNENARFARNFNARYTWWGAALRPTGANNKQQTTNNKHKTTWWCCWGLLLSSLCYVYRACNIIINIIINIIVVAAMMSQMSLKHHSTWKEPSYQQLSPSHWCSPPRERKRPWHVEATWGNIHEKPLHDLSHEQKSYDFQLY